MDKLSKGNFTILTAKENYNSLVKFLGGYLSDTNIKVKYNIIRNYIKTDLH